MGEAIEDVLRRDWTARAYDRVATRALEAYGPEITGLLSAQLRSTSDALEVFSMFSDDLWRGLPGFQWRCSLRAWAYKLARNAAIRWAKARARRSRREVPLSDASAVVAARRTSSFAHCRGEKTAAVRDLRGALPAHDQTLLVLRIDKQMAWRDIASAMSDAELSSADLHRETARLRKRYHLATNRLRELARERGLLADKD